MALESLRKGAKSWVAAVFIGLLILSFAVWGIGDMFRASSGDAVARVGKTEVSIGRFYQIFERSVRDRSIAQPGYSYADAQAEGLDRQVLFQLMGSAAIQEAGKRLGVEASDTMVADALRQEEVFRGPTGAFSPELYVRALEQQGLERQEFEQNLREDLTQTLLLFAISQGLGVPDAYFDTMLSYQIERRRVASFTITADQVGALPAPLAEDLQAFYQDNSERFRLPELRAATLLIASEQAIAASLEPSEEAVRARYERQLATFTEPETRTIRRLVFPTRAEAEEALAAAQAGTTLEALAEGAGQDPASIDLGPVRRGASILDEAMLAAAFAAPQAGLLPEPVQGALAWAIVSVDAITPETVEPFEAVRDGLAAQLAAQEARTRLSDLRDEAEDLLAQGDQIDQIAEQIGLTTLTIPEVTRNGFDRAGNALAALAGYDNLLEELFFLEENIESDVLVLPDGGFALARVTEIQPSRVPPLEEIRAQVEAAYSEEKALAQLALLVDERRRSLADPTIEALAESFGATVDRPEPVMRSQVTESLDVPVIADLFRARPGDIVTGPALTAPPAEGGESVPTLAVATVEELLGPDEQIAQGPFIDQLRFVLDEAVAQEFEGQFVAGLQQDFGTRINERNVQAVIRARTGQQGL